MISLLQLSNLEIIGINSSILFNTFKSSFGVIVDQYILPLVNVLDQVLPFNLTINPFQCPQGLRLNITYDLY